MRSPIAKSQRSSDASLKLGFLSGLLLASASLGFSCGGTSEAPPGGSAGSGGDGGAPAATCEDIQHEYDTALEAAKVCSPSAPVDECTEQVVDGLTCSCPSFANPDNADALERLASAASAFRTHNCSSGNVCGPCQTPSGARCSPAGRCENVYGEVGRSCKVAGVTYLDGEGGIPDPTSCNTCSCVDGQLACTEIYCPSPCPAGQTLGQQCAACGPTDACLVVEHACFPSCQDGCGLPGTLCVNGVCISGVCG